MLGGSRKIIHLTPILLITPSLPSLLFQVHNSSNVFPCAIMGWLRGTRPTPHLHNVAGISAIAIAVGNVHKCAIAAEGGIKCWEDNGFGQLGIGNYKNQNRPANVTGACTKVLEMDYEIVVGEEIVHECR